MIQQDRINGPSLTFMLIMLGVISPFALQIFLPSMPGLVVDFGASHTAVQLTISLYVGAFAFAQLGYGPLSDRFGRRRVILVGLAIYIIAPLICATAQSIQVLVAGRALQAIGGCAGLMFARVIARDLYGRNRAAGVIGFVTMVTALLGSATPILGGWIDVSIGWRANFWMTSALGLVVFVITLLWLPETRPKGNVENVIETFRRGFQLLRSPAFVGYAGHGTCTLSAWYAMLAGLPFIMVDVLEQPTTAYGLYFPFLSLGYMAGNLITARVARNWGIHRLIFAGVGLALIACTAMVIWNLALTPVPLALFLPMGLISLGHGMSQPGATSSAIGIDPALAGSAAGFMGFGQWLIAAVTAQAVGMTHNGTIWPTMAIVVGFTVLSWLSYLLARWGEARNLDSSSRADL
jgi:DHA1 family bicyclomycin/chloramphenicol resistance-like MFS transporter